MGTIGARQLGFLVGIISGLLLIAGGYPPKARTILPINGVNVVMVASALMTLF